MSTLDVQGEIITLREALDRLGLDIVSTADDALIEWKGYPKPFACGHTRLAKEGYASTIRVSQHRCSGTVLFAWRCVSSAKPHFALNCGAFVSIDTREGDTFLHAGIYG